VEQIASNYRCETGNLFLPSIQVVHPVNSEYTKIIGEFEVTKTGGDAPLHVSAPGELESEPVSIHLRPVNENRHSRLDSFSAPKLHQSYHCSRPGVCYDLASVRFKPGSGSTVWYSSRINPDSFYFNCLMHSCLAHAAAVKGNAVLHAGCFSIDGAGHLLVGESCSGKSTLCIFAMLLNGKTVSDDMLIVAEDKKSYYAKAFRSPILAREETYKLLPMNLQARFQAVETETEVKYRLNRSDASSYTSLSNQIHSVTFPRIVKDECIGKSEPFRLCAMDKSLALKHVMKSIDSTVLMPGLSSERVSVTQSIVRTISTLPCYELKMTPAFLIHPAESMSRLVEDFHRFSDG